MPLREVIFRMFATYAISISASFAVAYILNWVIEFSDPYWLHRIIVPLFLIAFLTSLTWILAYSKDGLSSNQLLFRYLIAFVINFCIVVSILEYVRKLYEWTWEPSRYIVIFFSLAVLFVSIITVSALQSKGIAEQCNRDLIQRQERRHLKLED